MDEEEVEYLEDAAPDMNAPHGRNTEEEMDEVPDD